MDQLDMFAPPEEETAPRLELPETARREVIRAMARLLLGVAVPQDESGMKEMDDEQQDS